MLSGPSLQTYYTSTIIPHYPVLDTIGVDTMLDSHKQTSIEYFNGLGNPLLDIEKSASGATLSDLLTPRVYDSLGRETKAFTTFTDGQTSGSFRPNAFNQITSYYSNPAIKFLGTDTTSVPFTQVALEASPSSRPVESGEPGATWKLGGGRSSKINYQINTGNTIYSWNAVGNGNGASQGGFYPSGTIFLTTETDENGGNVTIQTDIQGNVIGKSFSGDGKSGNVFRNIYIYNDFDQLAYILTPGAIKALNGSTSFTESTTDPVFYENVYAFHYDGRGRLVETKSPGKAWTFLVYNQLNQLVLTQNGYERANSRWSYKKYDGHGRIVQTGEWGSAKVSRSSMQSMIDGPTVLWEDRLGNPSYPGTSFPQAGVVPFVTYYYDDYNFTGASEKPFYPNALYATNYSSEVYGRLTGSSVSVLSTANSLVSVSYYDNKGQLIQNIQDDNTGGKIYVSNRYDFIGHVLQSQRSYTKTGTTIVTRYSYDKEGRHLDSYEKINGDNEVHLSHYEYNEIGQLIRKDLHGTGSTTQPYTQYQDYRYNERGWLTSINNETLKNDGGITNADSLDLFGETIHYQEPSTLEMPQYGGNVASILSQSKTSKSNIKTLIPKIIRYGFQYDSLNRMTGSKLYTSSPTAINFQASSGLSEQPTYDVMGNVTSLNRTNYKGEALNSLTYTYQNNGNRLTSVSDKGLEGISSSYSYDSVGNILTDSKKGITIHYNYFNLPDLITKGSATLQIYYDGEGNKLSKVFTSGATYLKRDYLGEIELTTQTSGGTPAIDFIHTGVGRATPSGTRSYKFLYDYYLTDHVGNTRVDFQVGADNKSTSLLQVQNYYPFGRDTQDSTQNVAGTQSYKFGGKENEQELALFQYDFGARYYNPIIARWNSPDPAEQFDSQSPYSALANNPISTTDPNGLYDYSVNGVPGDFFGENFLVSAGLSSGNGIDLGAVQTAIDNQNSNYYAKQQQQKEKQAKTVQDAQQAQQGQLNEVNSPVLLFNQTSDGTRVSGTQDYNPDLNAVHTGEVDVVSDYTGPSHGATVLGGGGGAGGGSGSAQGSPFTPTHTNFGGIIAAEATAAGSEAGANPVADAILAGSILAAPIAAAAEDIRNNLPIGTQYTLRAIKSGQYPNYVWGQKNPVGTITLKAGSVYKIGETMNYDPATGNQWRYPETQLKAAGLKFYSEYLGTKPAIYRVQIEKIVIYTAYHGFNSPPGNKAFK